MVSGGTAALFGDIENATITNFMVSGELTSIIGSIDVAFVVGHSRNSEISDVIVEEGSLDASRGSISSPGFSSYPKNIGGIVGTAISTTIRNCVVATKFDTDGGNSIGGIVGWSDSSEVVGSAFVGNVPGGGLIGGALESIVAGSFASGSFNYLIYGAGDETRIINSFGISENFYGLIPSVQPDYGSPFYFTWNTNEIQNSYWVSSLPDTNPSDDGNSASILQLQCPVSASDVACNT